MSTTSIGPTPGTGGNESHGNADGQGNKTLGENVKQQPEAGNSLTDDAAPDVPAPGGKAEPGIAKGPKSYPDGPNVAPSAAELDAARGKPGKS